MDPNATWQLLFHAIRSKDWDAVCDHAETLLNWLDRGGFPPDTSNGIVNDQFWNTKMARFACELAKSVAQRQWNPTQS